MYHMHAAQAPDVTNTMPEVFMHTEQPACWQVEAWHASNVQHDT